MGDNTDVHEPSRFQQAIYDYVPEQWRLLKQLRARQGRAAHGDTNQYPPIRPRNVVIQATAGSGKSTVLRELCGHMRDARIDVVSFTARVAHAAAARLPPNATSVTLHSAGKRGLEGYFQRRFAKAGEGLDRERGDGELAPNKVARIVASLKEQGRVGQYVPAALVARLVGRAKAAGLVPGAPGEAHVGMRTAYPVLGIVYDDGRDDPWRDLMENFQIEYADPGRLVAAARTALRVSLESSGAIIDFDDMVYVPTVLRDLRFTRRDVVMVDELQDLDAVQRRMVVKMCGGVEGSDYEGGAGATTGAGTPRTFDTLFVGVGDAKQCQPAGTKVTLDGGQTKNIEDVVVGDKCVQYSRREACFLGAGSWNAKTRVLATGKRWYDGQMIKVSAGNRSTECTPEHRWVTRFANRGTDKCVVYIMRRGDRYRMGWCQLFAKSSDADGAYQGHGSMHLGTRATIEKADAAWIVAVFANRTEASITESILACEWGIPTIPFEHVDGANHLTRTAIDTFFGRVNLSRIAKNVAECLAEHGRDIRFPFWRSHDAEGRVRKGRTTVFETEACNLLDGLMMVPVYIGHKAPEWETVHLSSRDFSGDVYSLEVDGAHTYVADGIGTHNCIFAWRGADSDSMDRCRDALDCVEMPLSICYRCPTSHLDLARAYAPEIEARPGAPVGTVVDYRGGDAVDGYICTSCGHDEEHCPCESFSAGGRQRLTPAAFRPGDAVICRLNAPLVQAAYWLMRARVPCRVVGRDFGRGLISLVEGVRCGDADVAIGRLRDKLRRYEARDLADKTLDGESSDATRKLADSIDVLAAVVENLVERVAACEDCRAAAPGTTCVRHSGPRRGPSGDTGDSLVTTAALCAEVDHLFGDGQGDGSDVVSLSSIHRAKGGEWDRVWWLDQDNCRPRRRRDGQPAQGWAAQEALNIMFVALTRARDSLFFISSDDLA